VFRRDLALVSSLGTMPDDAHAGLVKSPLVDHALDEPDADSAGTRGGFISIFSPTAIPTAIPIRGLGCCLNGTRIKSLVHMVAVLRDLKIRFRHIEFDQRACGPGILETGHHGAPPTIF